MTHPSHVAKSVCVSLPGGTYLAFKLLKHLQLERVDDMIGVLEGAE